MSDRAIHVAAPRGTRQWTQDARVCTFLKRTGLTPKQPPFISSFQRSRADAHRGRTRRNRMVPRTVRVIWVPVALS